MDGQWSSFLLLRRPPRIEYNSLWDTHSFQTTGNAVFFKRRAGDFASAFGAVTQNVLNIVGSGGQFSTARAIRGEVSVHFFKQQFLGVAIAHSAGEIARGQS